MKFVIQCTTQASVTIDQKLYSEIGKGFLVLIGICDEDTKETADKMVRKLIGMRIFSDENGKTNLALKDVDGQLLLVSQFTLYADCRKGNRPSFIKAGAPPDGGVPVQAFYGEVQDPCGCGGEGTVWSRHEGRASQ